MQSTLLELKLSSPLLSKLVLLVMLPSSLSIILPIRETVYRYEEKRWAPKDGKPPPRVQEVKTSSCGQKPAGASSQPYVGNSENLFEERKNASQTATTKTSIPAPKISLPSPPKGLGQVLPISCCQKSKVTPLG